MGRPRASAQQRATAFFLYRRQYSVREALVEIEQEFDKPVSRGKVGEWFKGFKESDSVAGDADTPFRWNEMHTHGIPPEAGRILLEVASRYGSYGDWWPGKSSFTFRDAKWLWRTYCALDGAVDFSEEQPDYEDEDIEPESLFDESDDREEETPSWSSHIGFDEWYRWSTIFSEADAAREIAGIHIDLSEIEKELAYKPWESAERHARFESAIERGLAQRLGSFMAYVNMLRKLGRLRIPPAKWEDDDAET